MTIGTIEYQYSYIKGHKVKYKYSVGYDNDGYFYKDAKSTSTKVITSKKYNSLFIGNVYKYKVLTGEKSYSSMNKKLKALTKKK